MCSIRVKLKHAMFYVQLDVVLLQYSICHRILKRILSLSKLFVFFTSLILCNMIYESLSVLNIDEIYHICVSPLIVWYVRLSDMLDPWS